VVAVSEMASREPIIQLLATCPERVAVMLLNVEVVCGRGQASGVVAQTNYTRLLGFQAHAGTINLLAIDAGNFAIHDREPIFVHAIEARGYLKVCPLARCRGTRRRSSRAGTRERSVERGHSSTYLIALCLRW
jgi:hypothetical protein